MEEKLYKERTVKKYSLEINNIDKHTTKENIISIINEYEATRTNRITISFYDEIIKKVENEEIVFEIYNEAKARLVQLDLRFMDNVLLKLKGTEHYNEVMYEKYCISTFNRLIHEINEDQNKITELFNLEELDIDEDIKSYNTIMNLGNDLRLYPLILNELEKRNITVNLDTYKIILQKLIENNQVFGLDYLLEEVKGKLIESEKEEAEKININGIININYMGHFNEERISKDKMLLDNYFAINYMLALREYSMNKNDDEIVEHQKLGNYYIPVLKGMLNRCIRRDQSDWMFVNRILGYTKRKELLRDVSCLNELEIDLSYGRMMIEKGQDIPKEYINSINSMSQGNFFNNLENAKKEIEKCLLDKGFKIIGNRINVRDYVEYAKEKKPEEELDRIKVKKVEKKYRINTN